MYEEEEEDECEEGLMLLDDEGMHPSRMSFDEEIEGEL